MIIIVLMRTLHLIVYVNTGESCTLSLLLIVDCKPFVCGGCVSELSARVKEKNIV